MNSTFVTAFLGNRDSYQVPYALAEADMLGQFITGTYCTSRAAKVLRVLPNKFCGKILQRYSPGIPEEKVNSRPELDMLLRLSSIFGDKSLRSWNWANRAVSVAAKKAARRMKSDLLLYEPYAWEAFTADYDHAPRKVLFHFHLHPVFEREIISQDTQKFPPAITAGWQRTDAWPEWDDRVVDVWKHADLVICASSFTRESLLKQGLSPDKCRAVPYGIAFSDGGLNPKISPTYSVLSVGSGIQRKGMHHLLDAWRQADLPQGSTLTLVCRYLDPCLEAELTRMPAGVTVLRGVSREKLEHLFKSSSLFVLPSLLEGFGQVFLEALSFGCPVLGTPNTCLPDLGGEADGVFTVPAGDVTALKNQLEDLSCRLTRSDAIELRRRAIELARTFTWSSFRQRLVAALAIQ